MSRDNTSWLHKHPITVYLILANGITWLFWIPGLVIGTQQGYIMPNIDTYATLYQTGFANIQHLILSIAFSLGVYGPFIGALVATQLDQGREGLMELWSRIKKWRVEARWYLAIVLITILLPVIPIGLFALTGAVGLNTAGAITFQYAIFLFLAQILTSGIGEEPGWRGFLLPRLQARFGGEKYIWVLGLVWAIWHYPLVAIQTFSVMQDVTLFQILVTILSSLAGQTMSLIAMTYLYVWVYNNTGSVFLPILFHAFGNLFYTWALSFVVDQQAIGLLIKLMPWLAVFVLQRTLGKQRFPGQTVNGESKP